MGKLMNRFHSVGGAIALSLLLVMPAWSADIKEKFETAVTLTLTSANLADSVTAGWQSDAQDNTALLDLDALVEVEFASVATAPANSKAIFIYAYGCADASNCNFTSTGAATPSGTVGTLTFPSVTTLPVVMPLIATCPYTTTTTAFNCGPFNVAKGFGGILPPKWGLGMINDSGMTLNVTAIRVRPVFRTVN